MHSSNTFTGCTFAKMQTNYGPLFFLNYWSIRCAEKELVVATFIAIEYATSILQHCSYYELFWMASRPRTGGQRDCITNVGNLKLLHYSAAFMTSIVASVTRFVEISLLWQNFKGPWALLDCLFSIWQTFVPTMAFLCYWAYCRCYNGLRLNNNTAIWSHWFWPKSFLQIQGFFPLYQDASYVSYILLVVVDPLVDFWKQLTGHRYRRGIG